MNDGIFSTKKTAILFPATIIEISCITLKLLCPKIRSFLHTPQVFRDKELF